MLKLRRDLSRAVTILEMIKRREKSKRELLHLTLEVFEKRFVCVCSFSQSTDPAYSKWHHGGGLVKAQRKTLVVHFTRNVMSDFGGEVMAEVLAEQALVRPQIIPLVPLTNQYRHQDHIDHKDYKSKVRLRSC